MKKVLLAVGVILVFGGYAYWSNTRPSDATVVTTTTPTPTTTDTPNSPDTGSSPPDTTNNTDTAPTPTPTPTPAPTSQYKNGTYTGKVADAFYGNLQVAAVISGGKLTDVKFLQYPNNVGESVEVNDRSNPILKSEAIAAQNAQVDIVSGATQSSEAFQLSLADALTQAHS